RIEALAGMPALRYLQAQEEVLRSVGEALKVSWEEVPRKLEALLRDQKEYQKEIERLKQKLIFQKLDEVLSGAREIKGVKVLCSVVEVDSPKALRDAGDRLRERLRSGVVVLGAGADEKAMLLCTVSKDLIDKIKAGQIIGELSKHLGGSGGGRPDMAQGGGPKVEKLKEVIQRAYSLIDELLG
ncbi:MAG: DHHA1 domain-containing protein, partial [Desulfatiglandales bacterium]